MRLNAQLFNCGDQRGRQREFRDEREVIGRDARESAAMHCEVEWPEHVTHEDVIDGEERKECWESAPEARRLHQSADVVEVATQRPVSARAGQAVQVPQ